MSKIQAGLTEILESWPVESYSAVVLDFTSGESWLVGERQRLFKFASVTKIASALAILGAISEGVFEINQSLGDGFEICDLLAHASGLPADIDFTRSIFEQSRVVSPKTRRIYSSAGFELLAKAFESTSGMSFNDYLSDSLFKPFNMSSAFLDAESWPGSGASGAAAGMVGSAIDLLGLANGLYFGSIYIDKELLETAKSPYLPELSGVLPGFGEMERNLWGLGFEIKGTKTPHWTSELNSDETYGHFGAAGTFLWIDPSINVALGVLTDRNFAIWAQKEWPKLSSWVIGHLRG